MKKVLVTDILHEIVDMWDEKVEETIIDNGNYRLTVEFELTDLHLKLKSVDIQQIQ